MLSCWRWPEIDRRGRLVGVAPSRHGRLCGDKSPMVSVTNVDPDRSAELLQEFSRGLVTAYRRRGR